METIRLPRPRKEGEHCIIEVAKCAYPPQFDGVRLLVVLRAYCDESYDSGSRIYTIAGFVARDKEWIRLSKAWRNRCLRDSVSCYHATDCEGGFGDFKHLSKQQIVALNTDLVDEIRGSRIIGWGTSVVLEDYRAVAESSEKAKLILGPSPYFLAMQAFLVSVCGAIRNDRPNYRVAFIFDQHEQFSGRAKQMYDDVKQKNPNTAPCMGSLTYAQKERFTPLQIADKLAYEIMKNMLNIRYDSSRPERLALSRMKEKVIQTINYLDRGFLESLVNAQV